MMLHELVRELDERDIHLYVQDGKLRCKAPPDALTLEIQSALALRKTEIITQLTKSQRLNLPPIDPVPRSGPLPHSFAQGRLWFLDQLDASQSAAYHLAFAARITGEMDLRAFDLSLNEVVRRHEILRTVFQVHDGQPAQVILPATDLNMPVIDLTDLSIAHCDVELQRLITNESQLPFDLSRGPLIRARLFKLAYNGSAEHVLLLTLHHIVFDGWSIDILLREFLAIYAAFCAGRPSPLAELSIQYADYAVWQREWLQGEVLERQLSYWKEQLAGAPEVLALPTDRPRPAVQSYRGTSYAFTLPEELTAQLRALSRRVGVTLFMTLLAAFQLLLSRHSGQRDICVGSPIANRNRVEIEGLIGFFVNTLVLRTDLSGNPTFIELLTRVREVCLGAQARQDVPFEKLVEELQPLRDMSHGPLFQVAFTYQTKPPAEFDVAGVRVSPVQIENQSAMFDMSLHMVDAEAGLQASIEYSTDLFDQMTIVRVGEHLQVLLAGMVAHPESRLSELPMLTESERHQLLNEWNATETEYPKDKCIHQLFEGQVERTPHAPAVVYEEQSFTYAELNAKANQLAHHLRDLGVGPDVLVGICMERSLDMMVAVLGILKAAGAYVPLDPAYPTDRLAYMVEDAGPSILLTHARLRAALPDHPNVICLDADWSSIGRQSTKNPPNNTSPLNLAYVIYTSGSTGKPKGVGVTHNGLTNFVMGITRELSLSSKDVLLAATSLSFDIAALELLGPLIVGGRTVVASQEEAQDPMRLGARIGQSKATVMQATPSAWRRLLMSDWRADRSLRILCGGESLSADLVTQLLSGVTDLWNLYGPTETTVWSTTTKIASAQKDLSIGRPIANTQIYLLDSLLEPTAVGVPGELYIGGAGLARGYLNQPELAAERFIPNPFSERPGERLYRTGDLARYRVDGNLEHLGRIDHQVKVRGFRIEMGEIEAQLLEHSQVTEAVVIAREDGPGERHLVAYLVGKEPEPTVDALRTHLQQVLPEYMVPLAFVFLEALPLTPNGKVDRKGLPAPDRTAHLAHQYVAPRNPSEEILAGIWAEVLSLERVGVHDSFFELGGHSLLATQVIARIREALGVSLPLRVLFETPDIANIAEYLDMRGRIRSDDPEGEATPSDLYEDVPL